MTRRLFQLLSLVLLFAGCGLSQNRAMTTMDRVHQLVGEREHDQALAVLRRSKDERPPQGNLRLAQWKERDRVLYWLEQGMLLHLAGRHRGSIQTLRRAERRDRELIPIRV
jgi:hypothetical protein